MNRTVAKFVVAAILMGGVGLSALAGESTDNRGAWFREAKFGLFVHWGLYAVPAGVWGNKTDYSEWYQVQTQMPTERYSKFASEFNPTNFNAAQWVKVAKDAGMKYMVITTKHHDGFCLYDSAFTDYNIVKATPYARDPMKDLAAACKDQDLKLGFFYSLPDWHHPEMPPAYNQRGFHGKPNPKADFSKYLAYMQNQVKELLTGYGPVAMLWFDGGGAMRGSGRSQIFDALTMVNMIRELQPDCLISDRLGAHGDFRTIERAIPIRPLTYTHEVCLPLNDSWGYNKHDQNWKSPAQVVRILASVASTGGNLLLNVGATADGVFPQPAVDTLREVGRWMSVNGESIYGTTAGPFIELGWGSSTMKQGTEGTTIYAHVFDWPADRMVTLPGLKAAADSVYILGDSSRRDLAATVTPAGLAIRLPERRLNSIADTVVVKTREVPTIQAPVLLQGTNGVIELSPARGILHGKEFQFQVGSRVSNIGYWRNPEDWVEWKFTVITPGRFTVSAEVASRDGAAFNVSSGNQNLTSEIPSTGDYSEYSTVHLGTVDIGSAGPASLTLRPVKNGWKPVNLRMVRLSPVTE